MALSGTFSVVLNVSFSERSVLKIILNVSKRTFPIYGLALSYTNLETV